VSPMERPASAALAVQLFAATPERRLALLRAVWPAAVGSDLGRRSVVVALDGSVLRVRVPDAAWRRVLLRMRPEILGRLRRLAGPAAPRALGFLEGPVPEPDSVPTRPSSAPPPAPPLVQAAAESIPDPEIRARFTSSAARYLGRFGAKD